MYTPYRLEKLKRAYLIGAITPQEYKRELALYLALGFWVLPSKNGGKGDLENEPVPSDHHL